MNDLSRVIRHLSDNSVGFDRIFREMEDMLLTGYSSFKSDNYPPYNLVREGNTFVLELAVAGYKESDLEITQEKGRLTITGQMTPEWPVKQHDKEASSGEYLHRGIAGRAFRRIFQLSDAIEVQSAELRNGMLTIVMKDSSKKDARKIPIGSGDDRVLLEG